jgi:CHAD domain-containing protein
VAKGPSAIGEDGATASGQSDYIQSVHCAMKAQRLLCRWKRRCAKLAAEIHGLAGRCQADGGAEQVHELRVALRRLRLYVRVGRRAFKGAVGSELRRWARAVAQASGQVRDYDVTLEWLQQKPESAALVSQLQARRNRLWQRRKAGLSALPAAVIEGIEGVEQRRQRAERLAKQLARGEARLQQSVREQLPRFFELEAAEQHEFRRLVRWWRYLRELALRKGEPRADGLLKRLIRLQEALGERQNLAISAGILGGIKPASQTLELRRLLAKEQAAWEKKTKQALLALARARA